MFKLPALSIKDGIVNQTNKILRNLPVSKRLNILVIFSLIALTLVGIGGWIGIWRIDRNASLFANQKLPAAVLLSEIRGQTAIMLQYTLEVSNRIQDTRAQRSFKKAYIQKDSATQIINATMVDFEKLNLTDTEMVAWNEFKEVVKSWLVTDGRVNDIIKQLSDNTDEEIQNALFGRFKIVIFDWIYETVKFNKALTKVLDANMRAGQLAREGSNVVKRFSQIFMVAIYSLAILISLLLALVIVNSIIKPLNKMRSAIVDVAENNDFTLRAEISGNDEAGQTVQAFNGLLNKVQQSLNNVLCSIKNLSIIAGKSLDTSERVSNASVKQGESASAMSMAIQQMSVAVTMIGESMQNVIERSNEAERAADTGSNMIQKSKEKMDSIADSVQQAGKRINELGTQAKKISSVMKVINEVSDKTKLLALNATIQAARAGVHGKGFAVVAEEVRELAKRTRSATVEVSEMINAMQEATVNAIQVMNSVVNQVHDGKELSDQASGYMMSIQDGAGRVMEAINEISAALNKQGATTQSISTQVEEVARMIEDNTESSVETARVSRELNELSTSLLSAVNQFKV